MKESTYQEKVLSYLEERGAWCFTTHGGSMYQVAGLPDVIACYRGFFLGLELKTGKYQATELQKQKLNNIQDSGGVGVILRDDFRDIEAILNYIDYYNEVPKQNKYPVKLGVVIDD